MTTSRQWPIPILAAACLVAAVLLGLTVSPTAAQSTLEKIKRDGVVTVAIADEAPYGYRGADGRVTGEAPEIARRILRDIDPDIQIEFVSADFGDLIPGLRNDTFDIAAAGMFITPSRCAEVAFSDPTYVVGEAFAVKRGNPKQITDFASISDHREASVGLIAGTVEYNFALVAGIPADRAPLYRSFTKAISALKAGDVDAVAMTALTARDIVADDADLEATAQFFPEIDGEVLKGYGGFAFRKEDADLVDAFNKRLHAFIGSDQHLELVGEFGFGEDMLPDKTAAELCGS